jgi:hypothetical protein
LRLLFQSLSTAFGTACTLLCACKCVENLWLERYRCRLSFEIK